MKVLILEVKTAQSVKALIRSGMLAELPSPLQNWDFNFAKKAKEKGKSAYVLVKEDSPNILEGCMIFSIHDVLGPFLDLLEVAPHNKGKAGKYKRISGCLIAYACGLSFESGENEDKGILTFKAMGKEKGSHKKLEEYYRKKYGAFMNPIGFMEIYPDQSRNLLEEYLFRKEN
jgi:hypothetical protein